MNTETKEISNEILFSRIPPQILAQNSGIPFEYLIKQNDDFKQLIECPICLKILCNPITCSKCAKSFCNGCLNLSLIKSKKCPLCQCKFTDNKIMGRTIRNFLDICKFKCIYENLGCDEIILYSNFFTHINNCIHGEYKCNTIKYHYTIRDNNKLSPKVFTGEQCEFKGKKNEVISHSKNCGLETIYCFCCGKAFPAIIIKEHCDVCYEKKGPCPYCKQQIKICEYDEHIGKLCPDIEITCSNCKEKYVRKNEINHTKIDCLENQIEFLKKENEEIKKFMKTIHNDIQGLIHKKRKRKDS